MPRLTAGISPLVVNDFTVKGSSTSATNSKKVGQVKRIATDRGMPSVFIGESTGARLPDAMGSRGMGALLGNDITQFQRMRDTPWAAAALGFSFGSSAWLACCSDFAVMRKGSTMSVSSPRLVSRAIGEEVDLEELGGWKLHAETTGQIDMVVDTDEEALDAIRTFLSYLPSHNMEAPPVRAVTPGSGEDMADIHKILPAKRTQVCNMRKILEAVVDKRQPVRNEAALRQTGDHRAGPAGRQRASASSPTTRSIAAAQLDTQCCEKIVDFLVLCDSFNIPIVQLVDTPGFAIRTDAERSRAPGRIMNFMNAMTLVTVAARRRHPAQKLWPCLCLHGRWAAFGYAGCLADRRGQLHGPAFFATMIVHGLEEGMDGFEEAFAQVQNDTEIWDMASTYAVHDVIKPSETRDFLIRMLDIHRLRMTNGVGKHLMRTWPTSY